MEPMSTNDYVLLQLDAIKDTLRNLEKVFGSLRVLLLCIENDYVAKVPQGDVQSVAVQPAGSQPTGAAQ